MSTDNTELISPKKEGSTKTYTPRHKGGSILGIMFEHGPIGLDEIMAAIQREFSGVEPENIKIFASGCSIAVEKTEKAPATPTTTPATAAKTT